MSDLVAWLNGCYDRAEENARAATPGPWAAVRKDLHRYEIDAGEMTTARFNSTTRQHESVPCRNLVVGPGYEGGGIHKPENAAHIADHDPSWRLADIARKRKILGRCAAEFPGEPGDFRGWVRNFAEATLRDLAEEFADQPGYDESWRP